MNATPQCLKMERANQPGTNTGRERGRDEYRGTPWPVKTGHMRWRTAESDPWNAVLQNTNTGCVPVISAGDYFGDYRDD